MIVLPRVVKLNETGLRFIRVIGSTEGFLNKWHGVRNLSNCCGLCNGLYYYLGSVQSLSHIPVAEDKSL